MPDGQAHGYVLFYYQKNDAGKFQFKGEMIKWDREDILYGDARPNSNFDHCTNTY